MKALEVLIDGKFFCLCVPPTDGTIGANVSNVPRKYMRAHVLGTNLAEVRSWQLPDIAESQLIAFRLIDVPDGTVGREPCEIEMRTPEEVEEARRRGAAAYQQATTEKKRNVP